MFTLFFPLLFLISLSCLTAFGVESYSALFLGGKFSKILSTAFCIF